MNVCGDADDCAMIGSVGQILVAPENVAALAHPAAHIASVTVTEKAYCLDPATGTPYQAHPDILHDVRRPEAPRSAPRVLVAALARLRQAGPRHALDRLGDDTLGHG